jgi:hypothetical protein
MELDPLSRPSFSFSPTLSVSVFNIPIECLTQLQRPALKPLDGPMSILEYSLAESVV